MRLIDADKIIQKTYGVVIEDMFHMHETVEVVSTIDIEKAPTVKAIPIEWFEWLLDTMGDGMYNLRAVIKDWERYKEDWEKENGK